MPQSPENQLNLSDFINALQHTALVISATILTAVLQGLQTGQAIDWNTLLVGAGIAAINAVLVLLKRYVQDNTGGNAGSVS